MTVENDLFEMLTLALQYDSYGEKYLTDFDRMIVQKKRSAIINNRPYELPDFLKEKIKPKIEYIVATNWQSPY